MPRYYFHLFNDETALDTEGQDLPNDAVALAEAAKNARIMAAESVCRGHLVLDHRIDVENSSGQMISTVYFRDVVRVVASEGGTPSKAERHDSNR